MKAKITKRIVDAAQPGERDEFIWDTDTKGFGLKVTPVGNRVYVLQSRVGGRMRRFTIGKHGSPWTPDKAREEAIRLLGQIADGKDPAEAKAKAEGDMSVAELCDRYMVAAERGEIITRFRRPKRQATLALDRSRIESHVKPLLGTKRLRDLTLNDLQVFMADIARGETAKDEKTGWRGRSRVRGGQGIASRTVGMLGGILQYAMKQGWRADNPARGVERYAERTIERFLNPKEITKLGEALSNAEQNGENPYAIAAIRLLMLTGCRKNEILSLQWDWVDFELPALRLPDSKTGAKVVPLAAPALELLSTLPRIDGNTHVIPGLNDDRHFVGLQKFWDRIRKRADMPDLRLHDIRHSFASVAIAGGDSLFLVGKLLGHKRASSTERYAHLGDDPLRAAADRIAGQIAAAMDGNSSAEVVRLPNRQV